MSTQPLLDIVAGASLSFLLAYGLFRLFVARETYFVWIMPLFLAGIFAGMWATSGRGSPMAVGAFAGLLTAGIVLGRRCGIYIVRTSRGLSPSRANSA